MNQGAFAAKSERGQTKSSRRCWRGLEIVIVIYSVLVRPSPILLAHQQSQAKRPVFGRALPVRVFLLSRSGKVP